MLKTPTNQAIALAGLSQAVFLVQQIARRGVADREAMAASIGSTLKIDADDVLDVYGGLANLSTGLKQLEKQLASPDKVDPGQVRYASTLMFLERKLVEKPAMVDTIGTALQRAAALAEQSQVLDHEVIATLAEAYQATISHLKPRVLVEGEQMYLADPENAQSIRALLLAGIRSVALWRQCGGARWRLLLLRPGLQKETRRLLESL
jgi:high frequency lysogenization protein